MSRNLVAIRHLEEKTITDLLGMAASYKEVIDSGERKVDVPTHSLGLLFFENSTRTRVSFEMAANYLGYDFVNFSGSGSSMSKGESLKDTLLTLRYERLEGLVMRHRSSGAPALAGQYFDGPIINAGDGQHEHPTQALGDALTILERRGDIQGMKIAIVGDVQHSRVARSNAWIMHKLGAEVRFVGPRTLMPSNTSMMPGSVYYDLLSGIEGADVVMTLRLQKERMTDGLLSSIGEYARLYQINERALKAAAKDALVMHPGPLNRGVEIDDEVADGPRSCITDQITNRIFVNMASLVWAFGDGGKPKLA